MNTQEDRTFVIDSAIQNGLGTKEEIELYEQLSIALELMEDDFNIIYCGIGDGIDFGITTPHPKGLPEAIGTLFYDIDFSFDVNIREATEDNESDTDLTTLRTERYFQIRLKQK